MTNSIQTLPLEAVSRDQDTNEGGEFQPTRIISTVSPAVVREDSPIGPKYQEALGYRFLINFPKYPGLCKMDDGRLVLTLSAALNADANPVLGDEGRTELLVISADDGMSWTQPRRIPGYRTTPMNLGGDSLLLRGWTAESDASGRFVFWFSDDAGTTWSEPEAIPNLPDGRRPGVDVAYHPLIEGDTARFLFKTGYAVGAHMRPYDVKTHTWGEPFFFPEAWRADEGSLARAANGDIVAAFRFLDTTIPQMSDHWMGIFTTKSTDDGTTWSNPAVHLRYGHAHCSMQVLPDRRMLMTYAARIGELDRRTYHGIEAVVSSDHGKTWDWEHRYIVFRTPGKPMHSTQSMVLSDGRILTVLMFHTTYTWNDGTANINTTLSHVHVVIWSV